MFCLGLRREDSELVGCLSCGENNDKGNDVVNDGMTVSCFDEAEPSSVKTETRPRTAATEATADLEAAEEEEHDGEPAPAINTKACSSAAGQFDQERQRNSDQEGEDRRRLRIEGNQGEQSNNRAISTGFERKADGHGNDGCTRETKTPTSIEGRRQPTANSNTVSIKTRATADSAEVIGRRRRRRSINNSNATRI